MHILIVPSWYKTPQNPIRGSFFTEQALALKKAGHHVAMLVPPSKLRTWNGLSEVRRFWSRRNTNISITHDDGFPVYRIPWWGWYPSLHPWARAKLALTIFDLYCEMYGLPDVLHGHAILYGGFLASYIGMQRNIPCVITEHAVFLKGIPPVHIGQRRFVEYALASANRVLAVSPKLAEALQGFAPNARHIQVLGNPVDISTFSPIVGNMPDRPFVFLIIGRLVRGKGHHVLIEAFARQYCGQEVVLYIAGDGKKRATLEKLTRQLGVERQIRFLGLLPRKQIPDLIRRSHVLVSASDRETFGVTLIEAWACGKPVIATASGGPESIVNRVNGVLVRQGDVDALANAMNQVMIHYNEYDPQAIRADCVARFSEDAIVKRLEDVYSEISHNAPEKA